MGGVAAASYARAGGPGSFAETGLTDPVHIAATIAGFRMVAGIAAAAAAVAAVIAINWISRAPRDRS